MKIVVDRKIKSIPLKAKRYSRVRRCLYVSFTLERIYSSWNEVDWYSWSELPSPVFTKPELARWKDAELSLYYSAWGTGARVTSPRMKVQCQQQAALCWDHRFPSLIFHISAKYLNKNILNDTISCNFISFFTRLSQLLEIKHYHHHILIERRWGP